MANRSLLITGAVLLALAILIPTILFGVADGWDVVGAIIFTIFIAPLLGIAGLVLLIVGAVGGRRQQQQQQVVVHVTGGGPATANRACPACRALVPLTSRFCTACGARM